MKIPTKVDPRAPPLPLHKTNPNFHLCFSPPLRSESLNRSLTCCWTLFCSPLRPAPQRRASSTHSFTYSLSSTSSRGRERGPGGGIGGKQSSSDTVDRSLRSVSRLAASEIRRAEDLVGVIGHHPELGGSHPELVDSLRMTSLRDPGSQRSTSFQDTGSGRMTSLRDSGSHRISSLLDTGSSRKTSLRDSGTQRTISLMDTGSSSGSVGSRRVSVEDFLFLFSCA